MSDPDTRPHYRARHAQTRARRGPASSAVAIVVGVVLLLGVGLGVGLLVAPQLGLGGSVPNAVGPGSPDTGPSPAARSAQDTPSSPTLFGRVTRVGAGDAIEVDVGGRPTQVAILGMRAPAPAGPGRTAECGSREALEFADSRLTGQMVTLVPDPTLPTSEDGTGRHLAYVVLSSQLSFTDAAVSAGIARADTSRPLWYAPVFQREQAEAVAAARGVWGPPCRARP